MLDLLVFGDMCIDYFYETEKIPKERESSNLLNLKKFFGGMGANTAVAARMLGLNVGFFSAAGADAYDYTNYLKNLGINLYIKGIFGETTHSIFIKEKNMNDEKFISFFYKGVTEKVDELYNDVSKSLINNTKCVFMARTYFNLHKKVSSLAKKLKKFVVYNPGYGIFEMNK
ncbi:MAG: carbohydrate kinase family protein, partial [Candidatus Altarchaeaceae archaeon]